MVIETKPGMKMGDGLLNTIDELALSPRLARLRDRYFVEKPKIAIDRTRLLVETLRATEGEHVELRWAKALKSILEGIPVTIFGEEITVGSPTRFFRGAEPHFELDSSYVRPPRGTEGDEYKVTAFGSIVAEGRVSEADWRLLVDLAGYFHGKTPAEVSRSAFETLWGNWYRDAMEVRAGTAAIESWTYPPGVLLFEDVVGRGLRDVIDRAKKRIEHLADIKPDDKPEALFFCQSVIMACEAVISFAHRYARLAREMAAKEMLPARRTELEEIAQVCEWVPEKPARNLHEAVQTIRFIQIASLLENYCVAANPGRVDQYLFPYFRKDLESGRITLSEAADLIGCLVTAYARLESVSPASFQAVQQATAITHFTLGGAGAAGEDASNELTYLFLHMFGLLRYAEPHVTLRCHAKMPRRFLIKGLEANRKVAGNPMFVNDEHVIDFMLKRGVVLDAARDYSMCGCSQPVTAPARHYKSWHVNAPLSLDLALHNGMAPVIGKRVGVETGDARSFQTFEDVYEAFRKQHEFVTRRLMRIMNFTHLVEVEHRRAPLSSGLHHNCIENGKSYLIGGSGFYPFWYQMDRGLVDVGDSLMAVKKLVFEEKKLTMAELIDALDSDFTGERGEEIRRMCLSAPKYGNDIDEVDHLVRDVAKFSAGLITSETHPFGSTYAVNRDGITWHYTAGKGVAALPNGRRSGEPLYDGSLSPGTGMDKNGPTAVLNSAVKADYTDVGIAILNQKFPLSLVSSPETLDKVARLVETFFRNGGTHIQYNFVDKLVLLDAKKHPEKHRDLIVRVAGYSAYFVYLTPEVQDEIIARTEQTV